MSFAFGSILDGMSSARLSPSSDAVAGFEPVDLRRVEEEGVMDLLHATPAEFDSGSRPTSRAERVDAARR